jgi:hypothetical protein
MLGYNTCYFDPLRSPGKPPLWWTSSITKTWGSLTKVTVVGFPVVMQDLVILCWALHNNKFCDNIIHIKVNITFTIAPMNEIHRIFPNQMPILV